MVKTMHLHMIGTSQRSFCFALDFSSSFPSSRTIFRPSLSFPYRRRYSAADITRISKARAEQSVGRAATDATLNTHSSSLPPSIIYASGSSPVLLPTPAMKFTPTPKSELASDLLSLSHSYKKFNFSSVIPSFSAPAPARTRASATKATVAKASSSASSSHLISSTSPSRSKKLETENTAPESAVPGLPASAVKKTAKALAYAKAPGSPSSKIPAPQWSQSDLLSALPMKNASVKSKTRDSTVIPETEPLPTPAAPTALPLHTSTPSSPSLLPLGLDTSKTVTKAKRQTKSVVDEDLKNATTYISSPRPKSSSKQREESTKTQTKTVAEKDPKATLASSSSPSETTPPPGKPISVASLSEACADTPIVLQAAAGPATPSNPCTNVVSPSSTVVFNPCGIQLLPPSLREQLFNGQTPPALSDSKKKEMEEHLTKFDLWKRDVPIIPDPPSSFSIPGLLGKSVTEHFEELGKRYCHPYRTMASNFAATLHGKGTPPRPAHWLMQPGWTRYALGRAEAVTHPLEHTLVFDVETCVKDGPLPILAVAVTEQAWYLWCSHRYCAAAKDNEAPLPLPELIPLEPPSVSGEGIREPRLVIGHVVSYDRQRILEQYQLAQSNTAFIDTASLHMATSGLSSQQRPQWMKLMNSTEDKGDKEDGINMEDWINHSSPMSLSSCYKLWCEKGMFCSPSHTFIRE